MNRYAQGLLVASLLGISVLDADPLHAAANFGVTANVPGYCEINASSLVAGAGDGVIGGTVFESCNLPDGFQVVAQHRALEANENVFIGYAGEAGYLRADGWSHVATRTGAKLGVRPISVQYRGLVAPLTIALTITML